ncbi:hypothetical protein G5714_000578 [Onychostoma macrolepis]|uniref:Uncharacterized protein n=1 Tax=Onychostoma macrolepis TaxID=369639 RepID=A0A7J6DGX6_9TELE|nr:hypothetical protein G5714_000578 [Onychostoma macrolepis]
MIIDENFTLTLSSRPTVSSKKDCGVAKCAVLQKFNDYHNCSATLLNDGNKIKNEIKGLTDNLQMLTCPDKDKTCNLSKPSCHLENQQISMWIKTEAFVHQVFRACLYTMQHVCPKLS